MSGRYLLRVGLAWLFASVLLGAQDQAAVRELVERLGADRPFERDSAQEELIRLSVANADLAPTVETLVEAASRDDNEERAERARGILRRIRWWEHLVFLGGTSVRAVDFLSGEVVWSQDVELGEEGYTSSFVTERARGGAVRARSGRTETVIHPSTGEVLETVAWEAASGGVVNPGKGLVFSWDQDSLVCRRSSEGRRLWALNRPCDTGKAGIRLLLAAMDTLYVGSSESLWAILPESGQVRWKREIPGEGQAAACLHGAYLYSFQGQVTSDLCRVDEASGGDTWRITMPFLGRWVLLQDIHDLLLIHAPFESSELYAAIEHESGREVWRAELKGCHPVLEPGGKALWLFGRQGISMVDPFTGLEIDKNEERRVGGAPSLVEHGGLWLLVPEFLGEGFGLYAFAPGTRKELWAWSEEPWESEHGPPADEEDGRVYLPDIQWFDPYLVVRTDYGRWQRVTVLDSATGAMTVKHEFDW